MARQAQAAVMNLVQLVEGDGTIAARFERREDGRGGWVRHGLYCGYHHNGTVRSEGEYRDGVEEGIWRDYHDNGWIACVGSYLHGREEGLWRFFDREGNEGQSLLYRGGRLVDPALPAGAPN